MPGCARDELASNSAVQVEAAAASLNMSGERFLERTKPCCEGFCFNGPTRVRNLFSISFLLAEKSFAITGLVHALSFMSRCWRDNDLAVEEFRGFKASESFAARPAEIDPTGQRASSTKTAI